MEPHLKCADASFITLCRSELEIIADALFTYGQGTSVCRVPGRDRRQDVTG